jgi:hypothetical protein
LQTYDPDKPAYRDDFVISDGQRTALLTRIPHLVNNDMIDTKKIENVWKYYAYVIFSGCVRKQLLKQFTESIFLHVMENYSNELYDKYLPIFKHVLPFIIHKQAELDKNCVSNDRIAPLSDGYGSWSHFNIGQPYIDFMIKYKLSSWVSIYMWDMLYKHDLDVETIKKFYTNLELLHDNELISKGERADICYTADLRCKQHICSQLSEMKDSSDDLVLRVNALEKSVSRLLNKISVDFDLD